jgi:hypothetical protein
MDRTLDYGSGDGSSSLSRVTNGELAERLGAGLQNQLHRFESYTRL